jgi:protease II
MAAVTLSNNESIDILAYRQVDSKQFAIQVKQLKTGHENAK